MFWILAGFSLKVEEEKDLWFSGRKCYWCISANGNTRGFGVNWGTGTCCKKGKGRAWNIFIECGEPGTGGWGAACQTQVSRRTHLPVERPWKGPWWGWQKSFIQTSARWSPSFQSCPGAGSSLAALPSCFTWWCPRTLRCGFFSGVLGSDCFC